MFAISSPDEFLVDCIGPMCGLLYTGGAWRVKLMQPVHGLYRLTNDNKGLSHCVQLRNKWNPVPNKNYFSHKIRSLMSNLI